MKTQRDKEQGRSTREQNVEPSSVTQLDRDVRVFVVDDDESIAEELDTFVKEHPACRVRVVGTIDRNPSNLAELVRRAKADVVLVDLNLGGELKHPRQAVDIYNGFKACQTLRLKLRNDVKIVAHTMYETLRRETLDEGGAHCFLLKGKVKDLVTALRDVYSGRAPGPPQLPQLVSQVELTTAQRSVLVHVKGRLRPFGFKLMPVAFALLWYLAEERRSGASDWLTLSGAKNANWKIGNPVVWTEVSQASSSEFSTYAELDGEALARWRNMINSKLEGRLDVHLIVVSKMGRLGAGELRTSTLRHDIDSTMIVIH